MGSFLTRVIGVVIVCAAATAGWASDGLWKAADLIRRAQEMLPTSTGSSTATLQARGTVLIERVLDGDTVVVRGRRERVRLANIDAPEMGHGYGQPGQPFSVQSTNWLTRKVQGRQVTLRCVDEDRYGRSVCDLFLGEQHVNRELVRAGLAWANTASARFLRDKSVLDAQREAQAERRGLWAARSPMPPWTWRKDCWKGHNCPQAAQ